MPSGSQAGKKKPLTLPGNESAQNPLATKHIAASKTDEAPAFGAKTFFFPPDDSTPPSSPLTAKLESFAGSCCSSEQENFKVKPIMYSATDGSVMKHQDNRRGRRGVCVCVFSQL